MSPTLLPGDYVLVNRLVYHLRQPRQGDIIAFRFPQAHRREFVKRVIGLPGDMVMERGERFFVNGALLAQAQSAASDDRLAPEGGQLSRQVPAGRLYVLGDNPESSLDSRFWGTVAERDVIGKAFLICWSRGRHWWEVRWNRVGRWLP
jgi:signal peptidase I